MNKKFLSAILFGALMVTSTGTCVSCKDYDDEIDAINSELTTIKSTIAALQSKVDAGNYVTGVTKTAEGITFSFSNGSPVLVELQGTAGKDGSVVTVEDGFLCIDGEATEISASAVKIENGMWMALQADGTYASTGIPASGINVSGSEATGYIVTVYNEAGEATEIKLPTASSTLESIKVLGSKFVSPTQGEIHWGKAAANDKWTGPLGAIAKGQLLVGPINGVNVVVRPVAYDLSAQELSLVDNQGNVAPVKVTAVPTGSGWITEGRAVSKSGEYAINIAMNEDVTVDNIASAFTVKINGVAKNKLYALMINGKVVSEYSFNIDTKETPESGLGGISTGSHLKINGVEYSEYTNAKFAVDKSYRVSYATERQMADQYLSLSDAQKVKAELLGVTIDGMTVNVPKSAANGSVTVTLNVLDVAGKAHKTDFVMNFGTSSVDSEATLAATTYTLTEVAKYQYININVADVFKGLTAAEVEALSTTFSLAEAAYQENFLLKSLAGATYHVAKDGGVGAQVSLAEKVNAKTIAFIQIPVKADNIASDAKPGTYNLVLTLKNTAGNEFKKVTIPVTIALPTFSDLYVKSASGEWDGTTFNTTLMDGKKISLKNAFNAAEGYSLNNMVVAHAKVDDDMPAKAYTGVELTLVNPVKNGALRTSALTAQAAYYFYGLEEFEVASEIFTIGLHSQFEAPKLVYYVDGVAKDVATVGENNKIALLTTNDNGKQGLAIQYGKGEQAFFTGVKVDGVSIADTAAENQVAYALSIKDVATATVTKAANKDAQIVVSENKGTLVAKFTDVNGVVTTATIAFE